MTRHITLKLEYSTGQIENVAVRPDIQMYSFVYREPFSVNSIRESAATATQVNNMTGPETFLIDLTRVPVGNYENFSTRLGTRIRVFNLGVLGYDRESRTDMYQSPTEPTVLEVITPYGPARTIRNRNTLVEELRLEQQRIDRQVEMSTLFQNISNVTVPQERLSTAPYLSDRVTYTGTGTADGPSFSVPPGWSRLTLRRSLEEEDTSQYLSRTFPNPQPIAATPRLVS